MSNVILALQSLIHQLQEENYDDALGSEIRFIISQVEGIEDKVVKLVEDVNLLKIDTEEMIKINLRLQRQVALLNEKMGIGGDKK
jgi:hypothetical protein